MNGATSLLESLVNAEVDVCFTNPGTSEMHAVSAFDQVTGIRPILGLFEGVVTGAADGYARMAGKPAATLLHLGPGLANGLANFHNAMRARSPVVNIVGDHATSHAHYEAPLSSDIESYARPVSGWIRSSSSALTVGSDAVAAVVAARQGGGQVATLIVPADCCWNDAVCAAPAPVFPSRAQVSHEAVERVARILSSKEPAVILMTGQTLTEEGLDLASRIANKTGARLMCDYFNARLQRGAGRAVIERMPYFAEKAVEALRGVRHLVLLGANPPVSFFAYPDKPSWLTPEDCEISVLARAEENGMQALEALADELGARSSKPTLQQSSINSMPRGELNADVIATMVAARLPEQAIVSDETVSSGLNSLPLTAGAAPHDWLFLTGGAIGQGMPVATGAAVACPDRKVVSLQGDGSAMYTLQSLWTQARENLDVTTIIYANGKYRILELELERVGAGSGGSVSAALLELDKPALDWVSLARGMGVEADRVTTIEAFDRCLIDAMGQRGPRLIEVIF